jgi:hypothetical protein
LKRGQTKEKLCVNHSTLALGAKRFNPLKTKVVLDKVQNFSSYVTKEMCLQNKDQPINAVWVNNRCISSGSYETRKYSAWESAEFLILNLTVYNRHSYLRGNNLSLLLNLDRFYL